MNLKTSVLALAFILGSNAFAKVGDFNAMIKENMTQQSALRESINQQINTKPEVQVVETNTRTKTTMEVSNEITAYNPKTPTDMLTFKKERSQFRASNQKQQDRLAEELRESDLEF